MSENNPYQVPASNLEVSQTSAHELNPNWQIDQVMNEAWQLTKGFKTPFLGALIIYIVILVVMSLLSNLAALANSIAVSIIAELANLLVTYPLSAGLAMIAVKRSAGIPCQATMIFDYYPKTIPIFLLYLLMTLLIGVGLLLLVVPGIYLAVSYTMAINLMIDKNMRIWEALEASRQAITACWFRTFGLYIVIFVIIVVSAIPLGIGLIWSLPFAALSMAIIYRNLFGVSQTN
jgi:hypothetical protein